MAENNVLRRDVVQIGFEVENDPFSNLNSELDAIDQSTAKVVEEAEKATAKIEAVGKATDGMSASTNALNAENDFGKFAKSIEEADEKCEIAAANLNSELETSVNIQDELTSSMSAAEKVMNEYAENGKMSAESSEAMQRATQEASSAFDELKVAQDKAKAAMDAYDAIMISGTTDTDKLAEAERNASQAASELASANQRANEATSNLNHATENVSETAVSAIETISNTLIAAKIADIVSDVTSKVIDMTNAFSDAEAVVVNATGASGKALDGLDSSMTKAFANHHDDIGTTAAAIGEVNTRMALTGQTLTDVTGKFLDFSQITGSDVVGSVQNVTKIMNKWGVEQSNVESILDRLAYAGQIAGISVDALSSDLINSSSAFQQMGITLDGAISLLSAFELQGISSGSALTAMRTAVNGFSKDGLNASTALRSVINEIATMENSAEATALACETFGSKAGVEMATAIRSGVISVEMLSASLDEADGTLQKTAETGETLSQKWETASNKLEASFSSVVSPAVEEVSGGIAELTDNFGEFLMENPAVTKAITALAVGLGVASVSIAAVTFATTVAIPAITALGSAINFALGPIGWIAAGATVLTGGIMLLQSAFDDTDNSVEDYNGTLEECRKEIERTSDAHRKAVARYGENSEAAKKLEGNLEKLNAQYRKGGGVLAELEESIKANTEAFEELSKAQDKAMSSIEENQVQGFQAVSMLEALSSRTQLTTADLDVMSQYADYLNDTFNCNIKVNYETGELTGFNPELVAQQIIDVTNEKRVQQAMDFLTNTDFTNDYIEAVNHLIRAREEFQKIENSIDPESSYQWWDYIGYEEAAQAVEDAESEMDRLNSQLEQNGAIIDETGKTTEILRKSFEESAKSGGRFVSVSEALSDGMSDLSDGTSEAQRAVSKFNDEIYNLALSYDVAYEAASQSIEGQYALWDKVEAVATTSIYDINSALESQNAYWESYSSNLEALQERASGIEGLSDLLATMADGSEESASAIAALAGASDEELSSVVANWENVKANQDEAARSMADTATQFSEKVSQMEGDMQDLISEMDMAETAQANATRTVNAYMDALLNGINGRRGEVTSAIQSLMNAGSATGITVTAPAVEHNATGTMNSADVFVAGEEGPELVVGKGGSTVFPTGETNRIVDAVRDFSGGYTPQNSGIQPRNQTIVKNETYAPNFVLNMNGASATTENKRKVQRWIKESISEIFENLASDNEPIVEV